MIILENNNRRLLKQILLVLSLLGYSRPSWCTAPVNNQLVTAYFDFLETSPGYRTQEFDSSYQHSFNPKSNESFYSLDASYLDGQIDSLKFDYEKFSLRTEVQMNDLRLISSLGVVNRTMGGLTEGEGQALIGRLGLIRNFKTVVITLEGGEAVYADSLQSVYSTEEFLRGPYFKINALLNPTKKWKINFNHQSQFFSDDNRRLDDDFSILYGIFSDWPWLWVGAGYERIEDSLPTTLYWSPKVFTSYGPRMEAAFPIYQGFSFSLGLSYNFFDDVEYGYGTGYYGVLKILHSEANNRQFWISAESVSSKQEGSPWTSTLYAAGFAWPF